MNDFTDIQVRAAERKGGADVLAAPRVEGLDIAETPTSKRDLARIQAAFDAWRAETGLSNRQISRTLALSAGENFVTSIEGDSP
jgi:hypothetical protein